MTDLIKDGSSKKLTPVLGKEDWVGKLVLNYFDKETPVQRVIPFYENVYITETQTSRLTSYKPIGRAGENFAYAGADARSLKVKFNITLPHLYSTMETPNSHSEMTRQYKKALILYSQRHGLKYKNDDTFTVQQHEQIGGVAKKYDQKYESLLNSVDSQLYAMYQRYSPMYRINSGGSKQRRSIIDRLTSMIASIRSSVVNDATDPKKGPPIIRLHYGILYDNVPCICKSYNISYDPVQGFDTKTLLPRLITISLDLVETRQFSPAQETKNSDGIMGWEVILTNEHNGVTLDPR